MTSDHMIAHALPREAYDRWKGLIVEAWAERDVTLLDVVISNLIRYDDNALTEIAERLSSPVVYGQAV